MQVLSGAGLFTAPGGGAACPGVAAGMAEADGRWDMPGGG